MSDRPEARRAGIVGTGLIGASIGLALREQGWTVTGDDQDPARAAEAVELGAIDAVGTDPRAAITFVATPVGSIVEAARRALAGPGLVTDVGGVKGPIAAAVADPRFVGGHPMAGSEQAGITGARADLFRGAVWVLTPNDTTDDAAYVQVRSIVSSFGAEVVALSPSRHDRLVAVVSHVPHLAAASLMRVADDRADEHRALLRLAAGGFRDMTRIASGNPAIWPDVCADNADAIGEALDELMAQLSDLRAAIGSDDRRRVLALLEQAQRARVNLPVAAEAELELAELRVAVFDRPGEIARVATLATDIDVNIYDLEIAHSAEGQRGVMIMLVEARLAERLAGALMAHDYRPSIRPLS